MAVLLVRDAEIKQLQARVEWLQKARIVMGKLNSAQARGAAGVQVKTAVRKGGVG